MTKRKWMILSLILAVCIIITGVIVWRVASQPVEKSWSSVILPASEESGNFPDLVNGDPTAEVVLIEYGDYQCTACAPFNSPINELISEYDGKVAVVFRTMILPYHQNGTAAASAALAAYNQGYWKEYKDMLFKNQDDWYHSSPSDRQKQFEDYFVKVTDGKGDLDKFRTDMNSAEVAKKLEFDANLAKEADVQWTPYFLLDGQLISQKGLTREQFIEKLREEIDKKLAN